MFREGWNRLPEINTIHSTRAKVFISVIVPFRNEQKNIEQLIHNLSQQRFSFHHLEVVMVDDHSSDNGMEILRKMQSRYNWLKIVSSYSKGKKEALRQGISAATGELIVTTDADCRFGKDWLQTIAETYLNLNPDMMVMPVSMEGDHKLTDLFQQIDYLSLQMVTAGAFGIGNPIISSGANLAFKKKSFLEAGKSMPGQNFMSGDDVFLLHAFKNHEFKIIYLKSAQAMVKTTPAESIFEFLQQRMRWGGKSRGYKDRFAKLTALLILFTNTAIAILPFLSVIDIRYLLIWSAAIIIKVIADWNILKTGSPFYSIKLSLRHHLIFSIAYPYYILIAGLGSLFVRERWKNRKGN